MNEVFGEKEGLICTDEKGKPFLLASQCYACAQITFPQKEACPYCLSKGSSQPIQIGAKGKVISWTTCHVAPTGFQSPYMLGVVEIEKGIRVVSLIAQSSPKTDLEKNTPVELVMAELSSDDQGKTRWGWKYKVIEGEESA